jgi:hypothetical protein
MCVCVCVCMCVCVHTGSAIRQMGETFRSVENKREAVVRWLGAGRDCVLLLPPMCLCVCVCACVCMH